MHYWVDRVGGCLGVLGLRVSVAGKVLSLDRRRSKNSQLREDTLVSFEVRDQEKRYDRKWMDSDSTPCSDSFRDHQAARQLHVSCLRGRPATFAAPVRRDRAVAV